MASNSYLNLAQSEVDLDKPTILFKKDDHAIYWLGLEERTAFRCNVYLVTDQDKAWIIDPGSHYAFPDIKKRLKQIIKPKQLTGMILCHQDPDVAASMTDWLKLLPELQVITTPRTQVLLPHYGIQEYNYYDTVKEPILELPSGAKLQFIESPFLHFPGAFVTYDVTAQVLFSGDIWAALDIDWSLVIEDFESHCSKMDLFNKDYMASNVATRGFVNKIKDLPIQAILPQHGSVIGPKHVTAALEYLNNLQCGLDILYPDLE